MLILNLQRMSTEDGPGIRTTVFTKGCPLSCKWCHNPESISAKIQIEWIGVKCIGCGICVDVCKDNALRRDDTGIIIDRDKCSLCLKCVEECPTMALERKGEEIEVSELFDELIKDKAYFGKDGGVTLSGGEVMMQAEQARQLLKMLKDNDINTAVDTSGLCKKSDIDKVLPYTDLFLYDIKHIENEQHKQLTGQGNKIILDNLIYLLDKLQDTDKKIWIRTPIIPESTDSDDNIRGIAKFLKDKSIDKWELCAFNNLCKDKYDRLYLEWEYESTKLITRERMQELKEIAEAEGMNYVIWTGATRLE